MTIATEGEPSKALAAARRHECSEQVRDIIDMGKSAVSCMNDACVALARFFGSDLPESMTYASGDDVPPKKRQRYFATSWGFSEGRISQMIAHGRVMSFTNGKVLPERVGREFAKLLDQPDQIPAALSRAQAIAKEEHEHKGWKGQPRATNRHAHKAVIEIIGESSVRM